MQVNFEEDVIISQMNEYEVLQLLMGECREALAAYKTSLEEDTKMLQVRRCSRVWAFTLGPAAICITGAIVGCLVHSGVLLHQHMIVRLKTLHVAWWQAQNNARPHSCCIPQ